MFNNILLPTDGSQLAETAASHGRMLAAASEATVHIFAVISDQPINEQLAQEQAEDAVSSVETNVEQESTVEHESVIERGNPYEEILSYARENDIDLIVMGTHGRRGLERTLLGSVTERVVRRSDCPVLAVPPSSIDRETTGYETVLIPTDGSPAANAAAPPGLTIAEQFGGSVRVLSVIEGERGLPASDDPLRNEAQKATEAVAEQGSEWDVPITTHVQPGTPHEVIQNFAESHGVDLIAMGTHGRSGIRRQLLGCVTERVLRTSDVPVLTVRQATD